MSASEPKKPARRAKPRAEAPVRVVRPKKGPKIIRNLHTIGVHVRIENPLKEKKFRVELKPRGDWGDTATIPVELQDSHEYRNGLGILFEVITETEAREIVYPLVGYTARTAAVIVREEETVISRHPDWDGVGKPPVPGQPRPVGPAVATVPGSTAFVMPEGGFQTNEQILAAMTQPRTVTVEKGHRHNG